jgi:hypothetical protein
LSLSGYSAIAEEPGPPFGQPSPVRQPGQEDAPCDAAFIEMASLEYPGDIRNEPEDDYHTCGDRAGAYFSEDGGARGDCEDGI